LIAQEVLACNVVVTPTMTFTDKIGGAVPEHTACMADDRRAEKTA
jgi:hypothetical protein